MLKTRLIPVLLLKNGILVRSRQFSLHQSTGNHVDQVERFSDWRADEIIYLDISRDSQYDLSSGQSVIGSTSSVIGASEICRDNIVDLIKDLSKICFVPLTIGGKIKSLEDIRIRLEAGADKVSINTKASDDPDFISQAAKEFGSQCIVISVDVKRTVYDHNTFYSIYTNFGKANSGKSLCDWVKQIAELGAGEILVQSIDNDGMGHGYDIDMIKLVRNTVNIPVIALGGVGTFEHLYEGYVDGGANALAAANIFHFTENSVKIAKNYLYNKGLSVRK